MKSIVRTVAGLAAVVLATSVLVAQQNTTVPQPRARRTAAPGDGKPEAEPRGRAARRHDARRRRTASRSRCTPSSARRA